jgi:hypothetical protein
MDDAKSYLQRLMDAAYERWQANEKAATEIFHRDVIAALGVSTLEEATSRYDELDFKVKTRLREECKERQWSHTEFYEQLSPLERIAVFVGNLNYQVGNGGFSQWVFNGYAEEGGQSLLRLLCRVGTPAALEAHDMVEEVLKLTGRHVDDDAEDDDDDGDEIERLGLDSQFYEISDQLLEDVEAYVLGLAVTEGWEAGSPMSFEHEGRLVRVVGRTLSVTLGMVLDVTPFEDCGETHVAQSVKPTLRQLQQTAVSLGLLEEVGAAEPTGLRPESLLVGRSYRMPAADAGRNGYIMRYVGRKTAEPGQVVVPHRFTFVVPAYHGERRFDTSIIETLNEVVAEKPALGPLVLHGDVVDAGAVYEQAAAAETEIDLLGRREVLEAETE